MNALYRYSRRVVWSGLAVAMAVLLPAHAFPPAPHHLVFGMVRDEQGNPLSLAGAEVLVEVGGAVVGRTTVSAGLDAGVNYRLTIALDSGTTSDLYQPTALRPTVPFRMRVKVGNVTYLPIEMTGASGLLTRPGESSRVDLTLGEDTDGDGLPDAWERNLIAAMGGGKTLADIRPGDDADGDGLTNLQEYLAGTYAFDPTDGFNLTLRSADDERSVVEFTVIRGRSYTIEASADLQHWDSIPFLIPAEGATAALHDIYTATDVRIVRATLGPFAQGEAAPRFFKLMVH
jgi:hypothetical protein